MSGSLNRVTLIGNLGNDPEVRTTQQGGNVVTLSIATQYSQIPDDSYAVIQTQGLLGGKYISLSPGGADTFLKDGGQIDQTQSAIVLENLINKLFSSFNSAGKSSDSQETKK